MKFTSRKDKLGKLTVEEFAVYLKQTAKREKYLDLVLRIVVGFLIFNFVVMPFTGFIPRAEKGFVYEGPNHHICYQNEVKISAHRAGSDLAPEETMSAFKLCLSTGVVDILEFDLHLTKDGQLVLLHDDTVNRTSNATEHFGDRSVKVKEKTLAELKELNFGEHFMAPDGSYPYRGLRGADIPEDVKIISLDEILTYLQSVGADLDFIIEIKDSGKRGEQAMDKLYATMVEFDIVDRTIVGTFNGNVTRHIDEHYPDVTRSASIVEVYQFYMAYLYGNSNPDFDFEVLQIPQLFKGFYDFGASTFIDYAHANGIAVQYWTINDPDDVARLVENGADTIITDNPDMAHEVISGMKG